MHVQLFGQHGLKLLIETAQRQDRLRSRFAACHQGTAIHTEDCRLGHDAAFLIPVDGQVRNARWRNRERTGYTEVRQFDMRQLQFQSGEEATDRVESGADLVPGRLNGSDNRRLDSVPDGSGGALDPVEQVGGRVLHRFKCRGDLAFDSVHNRADSCFDPVPNRGGSCFDSREHRSDHSFYGIDLSSDGGNDAVPNAGEEGNDPVPDGLKEGFDARPDGFPCGAEPAENNLCQRFQQI